MTLLPILLPKGYIAKIAVGQKITVGKVLAEKTADSKDEVIHLAKDLNISPKDAIKYLKKSLGSRIEKGDIIAARTGKLGIGKKQIIGEFSGTLVKLEEDTGDLFVRVSVNEVSGETITSPADGIIDFFDNEKIVLKTEKTTILAQKACGESVRGELLILNKKDIEDEDIKSGVSGKIVAGQSFEIAAIFKILAIGGQGIITLSSCEGNLEDVLKRNLSKALFLLQKENYEKLEKYQGKQVYLDTENKAIIVL